MKRKKCAQKEFDRADIVRDVRLAFIVQVDCYLYGLMRRLSMKELAKKQNALWLRNYSWTYRSDGGDEVLSFSKTTARYPFVLLVR